MHGEEQVAQWEREDDKRQDRAVGDWLERNGYEPKEPSERWDEANRDQGL